jgi:hypothetical protein
LREVANRRSPPPLPDDANHEKGLFCTAPATRFEGRQLREWQKSARTCKQLREEYGNQAEKNHAKPARKFRLNRLESIQNSAA